MFCLQYDFSCGAVDHYSELLATFCSSSHLCSVFAVITHLCQRSRQQWKWKHKSTCIHRQAERRTGYFYFLEPPPHRQHRSTFKWHKAKTIAAEQPRWWSEHSGGAWLMRWDTVWGSGAKSDVHRGKQTLTGRSLVSLPSHTYGSKTYFSFPSFNQRATPEGAMTVLF